MRITEKDLEEGEVICNKCEGGGSWPQKFLEKENPAWVRCPKCQGDGKLDWIHAITGKPEDSFRIPITRKQYPKLIASEIVGVQPMERKVSIWQKAATFLRVSKPWQQLSIISSKGKEEDGMKTLPEKKYQPF